jgi:hypothetical protein
LARLDTGQQEEEVSSALSHLARSLLCLKELLDEILGPFFLPAMVISRSNRRPLLISNPFLSVLRFFVLFRESTLNDCVNLSFLSIITNYKSNIIAKLKERLYMHIAALIYLKLCGVCLKTYNLYYMVEESWNKTACENLFYIGTLSIVGDQ